MSNEKQPKKNFGQKYIYGRGGKTLLVIFLIGAGLAIMLPGFFNPAMVFIALAITGVLMQLEHLCEVPERFWYGYVTAIFFVAPIVFYLFIY